MTLLERTWAIRASFALLFGGLISNLITVAAEPTNIKFQDVLFPVLDAVRPPYWLTNRPISVLGILLPVGWLLVTMRQHWVTWRATRTSLADAGPEDVFNKYETPTSLRLGVAALVFLALGIIAHTFVQARGSYATPPAEPPPLWLFLLPAGVLAVVHLVSIRRHLVGIAYLRTQWPVWGELMLIFSLVWLVSTVLAGPYDVFEGFFSWPGPLRYASMVVLSLLSSVTDNVALATMQAALIVHPPLVIWQTRLLFVLLTWSGGFTPFGCLQSLALNSRISLSTAAWWRAGFPGRC